LIGASPVSFSLAGSSGMSALIGSRHRSAGKAVVMGHSGFRVSASDFPLVPRFRTCRCTALTDAVARSCYCRKNGKLRRYRPRCYSRGVLHRASRTRGSPKKNPASAVIVGRHDGFQHANLAPPTRRSVNIRPLLNPNPTCDLSKPCCKICRIVTKRPWPNDSRFRPFLRLLQRQIRTAGEFKCLNLNASSGLNGASS
jgi:hypothetical protein